MSTKVLTREETEQNKPLVIDSSGLKARDSKGGLKGLPKVFPSPDTNHWSSNPCPFPALSLNSNNTGASRQLATLQQHITVKHNNTTQTQTHTHSPTHTHVSACTSTCTHTHTHKLSAQTLNVWEPRESRHADPCPPRKLGLMDKK